MITQLLCHLFGDYVLQSSWMVNNKTKRWFPAIIHGCVYFLPFFLIFHPSMKAVTVMIGTHIVIDRFRLAKYVVFFGRHLAPPTEWKPWSESSATGYDKDTPVWLATMLMIIVDNTLHLTINAWVLANF